MIGVGAKTLSIGRVSWLLGQSGDCVANLLFQDVSMEMEFDER